jgi:hypothetical protein
MIKNGIYSLTALVIDGPDVEVGGVLILHDGRIHGSEAREQEDRSGKGDGGA